MAVKIKVVSDFKENFPSCIPNGILHNDHPNKANVMAFIEAVNSLGYPCSYFGGIDQLIHLYQEHLPVDHENIYINLGAGLSQPYMPLQAPVLCDLIGLKYSDSPPFTVALMRNKFFSKEAVKTLNYAVPDGQLLDRHTDKKKAIAMVKEYPVIIKPNCEGSSVGITDDNVVFSENDLQTKVYDLSKEFEELLVEQYISGTDITVLILGNPSHYEMVEALVYKTGGRLNQNKAIRSLSNKANHGSDRFPMEFYYPMDMVHRIKAESIHIFEHFGSRDRARIDYRITEHGDIYFLEINADPSLSPVADAGAIGKYRNIGFKGVVSAYIQAILKRYSA